MIKVLLDTDIGGDIDDAICLAYLLKEPRCKLMGITTVCGESEKRAMIADAICQTVNAKIPIVAGADLPLQAIPMYPTPDGANALSRWPHNSYTGGDAVSFMYETIRKSPHEITLIGIGNMTNIAMLFKQHPESPSLLKNLYVMNGYFGTKKLPEAYYNWNSWADPLASKIVFHSKVPTHRTITLDITEQLTLEKDKANLLFNMKSPLLRAVLDFGCPWLDASNQLTFHDPLVAMSLLHHDLCSFERGFVQVETHHKQTMGATTFTPDSNGNVEISNSIDREKFFTILTETLNT